MTTVEFCENGALLELAEIERLTRRQRTILWATAAAVAATRLFALSKSLWDWDEALFCSAMRDFDVMQRATGVVYHPHPPGFPLFIALGHVARLFAPSDFRALQAVSTIAAMLLFPLTFALARSIAMSFAEAYSAALIVAFLPNVWFYGGTAFSDVSALATVIAACAALFASRSGDRRLYFAGSLLLGAAIAFRPQNALIGAYPWIAASWSRPRRAIGGAAIVIAVTLIAYGGAALASESVASYVEAVRFHGRYVATTDSFRNPLRPPLNEAFVIIVANPFHAQKAMIGLWAMALIGLASMRRAAIETLFTFGPFLIFAWLMLDWYGASRLSIAFMPLLALLAAIGISVTIGRVSAAAPCIAAALIVAYFVQWTWPALRVARTTDSPPVAAGKWVAQHLDRATSRLYISADVIALGEYLFRGYRQIIVPEDFSAIHERDPRNGWAVVEGATVLDGAVRFQRPRGRLWNIARRRFFEMEVLPLTNWVTFEDGWYDRENAEAHVWRWMGPRARVLLPAVQNRGELRIRGHFPLDALPVKPVMTVIVNGAIVDRFTPPAEDVEKAYVVATRPGEANELVLEVTPALDLARSGGGDRRNLGFQLQGLIWRGAP